WTFMGFTCQEALAAKRPIAEPDGYFSGPAPAAQASGQHARIIAPKLFIVLSCSRESCFRTIHIHGKAHSNTPTGRSKTLSRQRSNMLRLVSSFLAASKVAEPHLLGSVAVSCNPGKVRRERHRY